MQSVDSCEESVTQTVRNSKVCGEGRSLESGLEDEHWAGDESQPTQTGKQPSLCPLMTQAFDSQNECPHVTGIHAVSHKWEYIYTFYYFVTSL